MTLKIQLFALKVYIILHSLFLTSQGGLVFVSTGQRTYQLMKIVHCKPQTIIGPRWPGG